MLQTGAACQMHPFSPALLLMGQGPLLLWGFQQQLGCRQVEPQPQLLCWVPGSSGTAALVLCQLLLLLQQAEGMLCVQHQQQRGGCAPHPECR
jgi:hypothetical protein